MYGTLVVSYKQGGNARHSPFTQMRTSEWRAFLIFKKTKETTMSKELAKTYDPKGLEDRLYQKWLDSGYFHPDPFQEDAGIRSTVAAGNRPCGNRYRG